MQAYFGRAKAIFDFMTATCRFLEQNKAFARTKKTTVLQVMVGRVLMTGLQTSWLFCSVKFFTRGKMFQVHWEAALPEFSLPWFLALDVRDGMSRSGQYLPCGTKFLARVYFCGLAIFCVLQDLIFAIRTDCFFLLGINFCDFQTVPSIDNTFVFIEYVQ